MTARELNPNLFVVIRQNEADNEIIFEALKADIVMQPSQIIANHIRILLTTPLLVDFMRLAKRRGNEWTRKLVNHLKKILNDIIPHIWEMKIDQKTAPTLWEAKSQGKSINVQCLRIDPRNRHENLPCIALLLVRGDETILLPDDSECLQQGDQLLWCGQEKAISWMKWTLHDPSVLTYILTGKILHRSYVWRWLEKKTA